MPWSGEFGRLQTSLSKVFRYVVHPSPKSRRFCATCSPGSDPTLCNALHKVVSDTVKHVAQTCPISAKAPQCRYSFITSQLSLTTLRECPAIVGCIRMDDFWKRHFTPEPTSCYLRSLDGSEPEVGKSSKANYAEGS